MPKFDSPSSEPSKKPALVQFGHNLWNNLIGQYKSPKQLKVERMATAERRNILKQSTKERRNIFSSLSVNTYTAGEKISPQETSQKIRSIFGDASSVRIPRSNGRIEVATRRSDGLFYFAGKNTPCYLGKNEVMSKNEQPRKTTQIQENIGKRINKNIDNIPSDPIKKLEKRLSRGIQHSKDLSSGEPVYSPVAQKLGEYVARIMPPRTGKNSCGAAVGEILNAFGYRDLLPQGGRDGKKWDDFLDVLVSKGYFNKVPCSDPASARPGGVLVYNGGYDVGGSDANKKNGHVEIKSSDGQFVHYLKSDLPGGSARRSANKGFGGYVYYPVALPT